MVPPECFEKSELSGFFHLGWNAGAVVLLYYVVPYFEHFGWPGLAVYVGTLLVGRKYRMSPFVQSPQSND